MRRIWTLFPFGGGIAGILLAEPRLLREDVLVILLAAGLLATLGGLFLAPKRKGTAQSDPSPDKLTGQMDIAGPVSPIDPVSADPAGLIRSFVIPFIAAFLLSVLYWYRAAQNVGGFEDGLGFQLAQTLLFWVPAVVIVALYRAPAEGLRPARRSTFLLRILAALFAGLLGMTAATQIHAYRDARYDRVTLTEAMGHHQRHFIPDDVTVNWSHSPPELRAELSWPLPPEWTSYQELRRIRSLADRFARLSGRHDTDRVTLQMTRNGQTFAELSWSAGNDGRAWDLVRIDHDAAGISPRPGPADIRQVMDGIPPTAHSDRIHARMRGDTLQLRRAGATRPGPEQAATCRDLQATPSTRDTTGPGNGHGRTQQEMHPDTIRALARDWRALNHVIRDVRPIFRDISMYCITMPGYPAGTVHNLAIPASETGGFFEAQRHLPVPQGHALIQISDTTGLPVEDTGMHRAPVRLVWNDGRFGPSHNDITLWPWSRGTLGLRYRVILLDVDDSGNVILFLESLSGPETEPGTGPDPGIIRLEPGDTIELDSVYLGHLGWRRTNDGAHL